jgi:hypothetical protein
MIDISTNSPILRRGGPYRRRRRTSRTGHLYLGESPPTSRRQEPRPRFSFPHFIKAIFLMLVH